MLTIVCVCGFQALLEISFELETPFRGHANQARRTSTTAHVAHVTLHVPFTPPVHTSRSQLPLDDMHRAFNEQV